MTEPRELLKQVEPDWNVAHMEQQLAVLQRSRRRRAVARVALAAAAVMAVPLLVVSWPRDATQDATRDDTTQARPSVEATPNTPEAVEEERTIALADGSQVHLRTPETRLVLEEMGPEEVVVRLDAGIGEFDVAPNPERAFRVQAGDVTVEVIGTRFRVERSERGARVDVHEGLVAVRWEGGERRLRRGESGVFPPAVESVAVESTAVESAAAATPEVEPEPTPVRRQDWRGFARRGDHDEAFELLSEEPPLRGVADLMLAADAARFSGHALAALPFLRRAHREFPEDPRAPMAAFTEGRVLLAAGRHAEAATAFGRARSLEPRGSLSEDALAREAEALLRAGDPRADARVDEYRRLHPEGRRRRSLERLLQER